LLSKKVKIKVLGTINFFQNIEEIRLGAFENTVRGEREVFWGKGRG
jgi:hypothetical protein